MLQEAAAEGIMNMGAGGGEEDPKHLKFEYSNKRPTAVDATTACFTALAA